MNELIPMPAGKTTCCEPATRPILPMKTSLSVPAGLDWVIKQRIITVIACSSGKPPEVRLEILSRLNSLFSQRQDIHQITLYGYELTVLYSFLLEQEQQFDQWSADLLPVRATHSIRGRLQVFLPQLRTICLQVDGYANRPVHAC